MALDSKELMRFLLLSYIFNFDFMFLNYFIPRYTYCNFSPVYPFRAQGSIFLKNLCVTNKHRIHFPGLTFVLLSQT